MRRRAPGRSCGRNRSLRCLNDEQIDGLIAEAQALILDAEKTLIEEGTRWRFDVHSAGGHRASLGRPRAIRSSAWECLRQGDCFGEMSLLTGEPRTATVRAENDCEVLEISKPVMGELLRTSPECLNQLSALLAQRKLETEGLIKEATLPGENRRTRARIRGLVPEATALIFPAVAGRSSS